MKQTTPRKNIKKKPRVRRDSARFSPSPLKKSAPKKSLGKQKPALSVGQSKVFIVVCALFAVVLVGSLVDWGINRGKVYSGISVGEVDLGGKTAQEATELLENLYWSRVAHTGVSVFAHDAALANREESLRITQEYLSDELITMEEAREHRLVWQVNAASLSVAFDAEGLVEDALAFGRSNGGIFKRLQALFFKHTIDPRARYDKDAFETLAHDIDLSIGTPLVNYDILVEEGVAEVVEGHSGNMLDREEFQRELDRAFLETDEKDVAFVAHTQYAPLQISKEMAQEACERVNAGISFGAHFSSEEAAWVADSYDLGKWVSTAVEASGETWTLRPYLDYEKAKSMVVAYMKADYDGKEVKVRFLVEKGKPIVELDTPGTIPMTEDAIQALSDYLFSEKSKVESRPTVTVAYIPIPSKLSFDDALNYGVITRIAEYTTEYTTYATARNHNIHLAADILNNSIIVRDGGTWSFHERAGNCNEDAGFQGAGAIVEGEIVDNDIGGGICQVATTVFNAVYEAGYPVLQRHNHSIYVAGYPDGRDAAVNWPDLDFRWKNNTTSDTLLTMSYTDSTLTAALYGVSPEYVVTTNVGEWSEGDKFKKRMVEDEELPEGYSYIKTEGVDGSNITVVRTVSDKSGNILYQDNFISNYEAVDQIRLAGPNTPDPDKASSASSNN